MGEVGKGPPARCLHFILSCREPPGDFRRRSDFPLAGCGKQTKGAERKWETREEPPAGRGFRWRAVGGRWGECVHGLGGGEWLNGRKAPVFLDVRLSHGKGPGGWWCQWTKPSLGRRDSEENDETYTFIILLSLDPPRPSLPAP